MTKAVEKTYLCHNPACPQGSRATPGRFTSGITAEQKNMLTGDPVEKMVEGEDYGEGICPTCGEKAEPSEPTTVLDADGRDIGDPGVHDFASSRRSDPNQDIHDAVAARVADEEDSLTTRGAQSEVKRLVEARESGEESEEVTDNA